MNQLDILLQYKSGMQTSIASMIPTLERVQWWWGIMFIDFQQNKFSQHLTDIGQNGDVSIIGEVFSWYRYNQAMPKWSGMWPDIKIALKRAVTIPHCVAPFLVWRRQANDWFAEQKRICMAKIAGCRIVNMGVFEGGRYSGCSNTPLQSSS